jgi:hypothetical protein
LSLLIELLGGEALLIVIRVLLHQIPSFTVEAFTVEVAAVVVWELCHFTAPVIVSVKIGLQEKGPTLTILEE